MVLIAIVFALGMMRAEAGIAQFARDTHPGPATRIVRCERDTSRQVTCLVRWGHHAEWAVARLDQSGTLRLGWR